MNCAVVGKRAGRIERKIYVNLPNLKERVDLFKYYLTKVTTDASVDPEMLGRKTLWFSPSDIDSMIREAGLISLRDKRDHSAIHRPRERTWVLFLLAHVLLAQTLNWHTPGVSTSR